MNLVCTAKHINIDKDAHGETRLELKNVEIDQSIDITQLLSKVDLWAVKGAMESMGWHVNPPDEQHTPDWDNRPITWDEFAGHFN